MKKVIASTLLWLVSSGVSFADKPSVHGMLLFGKASTYASHLPMYHAPHDYQAIFKLDLSVDPSDPSTLSRYEKAKETESLFTLVPEVMDLTKVMNGSKKSFAAQIYQGHFERGGKELGKVVVQVTKVLVQEKLRTDSGSSSDFIVFGQNGEYYAAHIIKGNSEQPTYDAVMESSQAFKIRQPPCGRAACPPPQKILLSDNALPLTLNGDEEHISKAPQEGEVVGIQRHSAIEIKKMIYFETGDLN